VTSVDRTAYPRFPRVVSGRELAEAFTPSDGEVDWARGRTQDAGHLLGLVVWLKSYQQLGYFPKLAEVPGAVAGHVRGVLGLPDRVGLEQATERSAQRHRQFVRDRLEVVYEPAREVVPGSSPSRIHVGRYDQSIFVQPSPPKM
jgi:hypothetical protein